MTPGSTIAAELIALLEDFATGVRLPRVRALHLPRPETLDSRRGEFCALELEDGTLGLAFVLLVLEACRRTSGWIMTGVVSLFLLYALFGFLQFGFHLL